MNDAYDELRDAELEALRAFYNAWRSFHAAAMEARGDAGSNFRRRRMEVAAQRLTDCAHEVKRLEPREAA